MRQRLHVVRPSPALRPWVDFYWLQEGPAPAHARELVLPTGTMELVIELCDAPTRTATHDVVVCGARMEAFEIDTAPLARIAGVHFAPGGGAPLLGVAADELCGRHAPLAALWGRDAERVRTRLLDAPSPAALFAALDDELRGRLRRTTAAHPAVDEALRVLGRGAPGVAIAAVTESVGLSSRRFIELFARRVGLTPKRYWRVRRFQEVVRVASSATLPWTDVALACGYYDQAHFIRDFRAFSGLTPNRFQALGGARRNHVLVDG